MILGPAVSSGQQFANKMLQDRCRTGPHALRLASIIICENYSQSRFLFFPNMRIAGFTKHICESVSLGSLTVSCHLINQQNCQASTGKRTQMQYRQK